MRRRAAVGAVLCVAAVATACGRDEVLQRSSSAGGPSGAALFASQGCGRCHTLAAAGTRGTVGPDLDALHPSVDQAREVIAAGRGAMPSFRGRLSGAELRALSEYVAASSGP